MEKGSVPSADPAHQSDSTKATIIRGAVKARMTSRLNTIWANGKGNGVSARALHVHLIAVSLAVSCRGHMLCNLGQEPAPQVTCGELCFTMLHINRAA